MASNLKIDVAFPEQVQREYGFKTKRETVDFALAQLLRKKNQLEFLKLAGTIDFDPAYDYKAERWRKRR